MQECVHPVSYYPIMVLGNKCDLVNKRVVPRESGEELASSVGAKFFEVSALTGENMEEVNRNVLHSAVMNSVDAESVSSARTVSAEERYLST